MPLPPWRLTLEEDNMIKDRRSHTTLPVVDIDRAKRWYEEKLGLTPSTENPGGAFYELGGGTRFILYPTPNEARGGHTQLGITTEDVAADVAQLKERGVVFEEYDFPGLKTEGSIATTGDVRAAWFRDSENNMIGIVQLPTGAEPGS
jgi:catechol 2,3-dioxygenase-like lactoylglutathione lyase family enzyme